MASLRSSWLAALTLSSVPLVAGLPRGDRHGGNITFVSTNPAATLLRRDTDPTDFSWISKWASIGDSYTAGIGSGYQLGIPLTSDWSCSRGARTEQIYNQAIDLNGPLDLVMMTAGGNDLFWATMITNCILLAWRDDEVCQQIIDKAQENIDTIFKDNIRDILSVLNGVVKPGGYVVYSGYAPFFDTTNEDCADLSKQYWAIKEWWSWWSYWFSTPLTLSIDRRNRFNTLVANINKAISEVVDEFTADTAIKYKIAFSDWSDWGAIVDGQMCSPKGVVLYPEPTQEELQFIKRNTYVAPSNYRELKRSDADADRDKYMRAAAEAAIGGEMTEEKRRQFLDHLEAKWSKVDIYDSLLYKSRNPRAEALHKLDPRAPSAPNCPGDDSADPTLGIGLLDKLAANFHPNERGHENMAAFAMETLIWLRSKEISVEDPICHVNADVFTCWQKNGKKAFASRPHERELQELLRPGRQGASHQHPQLEKVQDVPRRHARRTRAVHQAEQRRVGVGQGPVPRLLQPHHQRLRRRRPREPAQLQVWRLLCARQLRAPGQPQARPHAHQRDDRRLQRQLRVHLGLLHPARLRLGQLRLWLRHPAGVGQRLRR